MGTRLLVRMLLPCLLQAQAALLNFFDWHAQLELASPCRPKFMCRLFKWICVGLLLATPSIQGLAQSLDVAPLVNGNTTFALKLYARLRGTPGNIVLSPYSVSSALAMTYAGARGQTAQQMAQALNFPRSGKDVHTLFSRLDTVLNAAQTNGGVELEIANSLWPQNRYPFRQEFTELLRANYRASISPLDFIKQPEQARATINQWVDEKTHHEISEAMPSEAIDSLTRLVLVDAVYFKGLWEIPFPVSATQVSDFYVAPGKSVTVPFMSMEEKFQIWQSKELLCLVLPYKENAFQMVILLPRGGGLMESDFLSMLPVEDKKGAKMFSIDELERNLTPKNISLWVSSAQKDKVRVWLPKFNLSCRFSLNSALQVLGMKDAFSNKRADFSGIDGKPGGLYLSSVLHQATVEVNEKGTEAEASTESVGTLSGPAWFIADHPFVFLIRHSRTGSILFMGRVSEPK